MDTITHSQVQEIVKRLSAKKLPLASDLLVDLVEKESSEISPQLNFMLLSLKERRGIMTQQAEQMVPHHKETTHETRA